jgi:1-deoxy-D-xylulose-5-phosphate reductoisomerase
LRLARRAGEAGGTMPAVLNAANEIAVEAFLEGRITFPRIWSLVEEAMNRSHNFARPSLDDIIQADGQTRDLVREVLAQ